ncbi:uncharacterized protein LOC125904387 [Epinephelus fuscoguttatus]|uniref:uncharacterized protein LOC125904387 n=1 Tax=Epinephelus fuscoguttatus TaxID=293821 RepID=UPI0020D13B8F|nr:uncharacterized protein LOC125904387 [Epinephelus fuscoguttatus]
MIPTNPRKRFPRTFTPFPRSIWTHPDAPQDDFDRVCQIIWVRAKETEEALHRGQSLAEGGPSKDLWAPDNTTSHRAEEQQQRTHDSGPSTRYEKDKQQDHTDFIPPYLYLSGRRHPYVARAACAPNLVMEEEMTQNDEEVREDTGDKQRSLENSPKEIWAPQSSSRRDKQSFAPKPQPLVTNPTCSATEDLPPQLQDEEDPPLFSTLYRDICDSEDEENNSSSSDSSDDDSESENNGCKGAPAAAPMQQVPYDPLADFPPLPPTRKHFVSGVLHDVDPKAKGAKGKRGLTHWTSQHQESGASHQSRMENVPQEVSSIWAEDQKSVLDLQTFGYTGQRISTTISCEELKAKTQPPPRVVGASGEDVTAWSWASVAKAGLRQAAAPQKKARPFTSPQKVTIDRTKVEGADGVDVTARSWASVAEAGLKVAMDRATGSSATPNFFKKVTSSSHGQTTIPMFHSPRPYNPNRFVRPGYAPINQHFGAQEYRANCPPRFRRPPFPL